MSTVNCQLSTVQRKRPAFTLIELLIVIAILGILAAIILVAVDPRKRIRQARNARRSSEVNTILNAILNYTTDNRGTLPTAIGTNARIIGSATTGCSDVRACSVGEATEATCADLLTDLSGAGNEYVAAIPTDPRGTNENTGFVYSATATGYYVKRSAGGRVTVGACNPEDEGSGTSTIQLKR